MIEAMLYQWRAAYKEYINVWTRSKIGKFRRDYAAKSIALVPEILSVAGIQQGTFKNLRRAKQRDTFDFSCFCYWKQ